MLPSQGCQWLAHADRNRNVELAERDHRNCEARGYAWPGKAYVDCRRFLADDRQRERWMELQMVRQQQQPRVGIQPQSPLEAYLPIDEETFDCFMIGEGAEAYIDCGER
ncbi:MAG TPA: hypothetical protein VF267_12990 [Gammaproteobacteria bacterium]